MKSFTIAFALIFASVLVSARSPVSKPENGFGGIEKQAISPHSLEEARKVLGFTLAAYDANSTTGKRVRWAFNNKQRLAAFGMQAVAGFNYDMVFAGKHNYYCLQIFRGLDNKYEVVKEKMSANLEGAKDACGLA